MKYLFASYRSWGDAIFQKIRNDVWEKISESDQLSSINPQDYDLIFFVGWSDIIPDNFLQHQNCICLHPSPLPHYRGGSPIQHQILSGETSSAVTLFIMNNELDAGNIVFQKGFDLGGDLDDIFQRIVKVGIEGILKIVDDRRTGNLKPVAQDEMMYSPHRRRKPKHSEIKLTDFLFMSAKEVHDKIRSLQSPYPNAFIQCRDGSRLFLESSRYETSSLVGPKRILVLGHTGMLGHMVVKYLGQFHQIETTNLKFPSQEFQNFILSYTGDYIINCAGAIPQKTKKFSLNHELPKFLERAAKCRVIHPATDCEMDDDEYGISKRIASEYIRSFGKKSKILQCSIIGPELHSHKSLLDWFLRNPSQHISGYTDAIWNGITTLQWAKIAKSMIENWDSYKRHNVVEGERISKFHLLFTIAEEFKKNVTIRPVSGRGKDKTLNGEIRVPAIRAQIKELIEYYYK